LHLVERNFPGISRRHHGRAVTHLLAKNGRIHPGQFPPTIAAMTKRMHPSLRKPKGSQHRMQECMQHTCFAQQQIDAAVEVSCAKPKRYPAALVPLSAAFAFRLDSFLVSCFAVLLTPRLQIKKNNCVISREKKISDLFALIIDYVSGMPRELSIPFRSWLGAESFAHRAPGLHKLRDHTGVCNPVSAERSAVEFSNLSGNS
jgi:hypothetical protein